MFGPAGPVHHQAVTASGRRPKVYPHEKLNLRGHEPKHQASDANEIKPSKLSKTLHMNRWTIRPYAALLPEPHKQDMPSVRRTGGFSSGHSVEPQRWDFQKVTFAPLSDTHAHTHPRENSVLSPYHPTIKPTSYQNPSKGKELSAICPAPHSHTCTHRKTNS